MKLGVGAGIGPIKTGTSAVDQITTAVALVSSLNYSSASTPAELLVIAAKIQKIIADLSAGLSAFAAGGYNVPIATTNALNTLVTASSSGAGVASLVPAAVAATAVAAQTATIITAGILVKDIQTNGCPGTVTVVDGFQQMYTNGGYTNSSTFVVTDVYDVATQAAVTEVLGTAAPTCPASGGSGSGSGGGSGGGGTTVVNTTTNTSNTALIVGSVVAVGAVGLLVYLMHDKSATMKNPIQDYSMRVYFSNGSTQVVKVKPEYAAKINQAAKRALSYAKSHGAVGVQVLNRNNVVYALGKTPALSNPNRPNDYTV